MSSPAGLRAGVQVDDLRLLTFQRLVLAPAIADERRTAAARENGLTSRSRVGKYPEQTRVLQNDEVRRSERHDPLSISRNIGIAFVSISKVPIWSSRVVNQRLLSSPGLMSGPMTSGPRA